MALVKTRKGEGWKKHVSREDLHLIPASSALWRARQRSDSHLWIVLSRCKPLPFPSQLSYSVQVLTNDFEYLIFNINRFHLGPYILPFISVKEFQIKLQRVLRCIQQLRSAYLTGFLQYNSLFCETVWDIVRPLRIVCSLASGCWGRVQAWLRMWRPTFKQHIKKLGLTHFNQL